MLVVATVARRWIWTLLAELHRSDCLPNHMKRRDRGGAEEILENEVQALVATAQEKHNDVPVSVPWLNFSAFSLLLCDLCVLNGVTNQLKWLVISEKFLICDCLRGPPLGSGGYRSPLGSGGYRSTAAFLVMVINPRLKATWINSTRLCTLSLCIRLAR